MDTADLFQAGKLREAVAAAQAAVRAKPGDLTARWLLCEFLCFTGELDRADKHLELIGGQDPKAGPTVALFRQLLRAAIAREQFYAAGRLPEFLGQPPEDVRLRLQASTLLRGGGGDASGTSGASGAGASPAEAAAEAADLLGRAEAARPRRSGVCDGQPFDDLRDLDDLTAAVFEVLTSTGKYYWVPVQIVRELELKPPSRARDLLWRQARLVVADGPAGDVYLPALYAGSHAEADDALRLGRSTRWDEGQAGVVRGVGQKMFLAGDRACGIGEVTRLSFESAAAGAAAAGAGQGA